MTGRCTALALAFGLTLSPALAEEKKAEEHAGSAAKVPAAPRPPKTSGARGGAQAPKPDNHPGEQKVDRLMKMTPQQREQALRNLPPVRRANIQRRINEIEKLPPAIRTRVRTRQELLNSLPPQRQNQVRRSVQQFVNMPDERRGVMTQELNRMAPLTDEDRRAYMNTEEFRNKFSAREQQMLSHLAEITPPPQ
jgi:hypothetical protein